MKKVLLFFALMLAMAAQADVLGEYSFVGTLGDKIPVTKYDTLGCFGMGVAFDGVYIKVKQ